MSSNRIKQQSPLDAERVAVAKAMGLPTQNVNEWLNTVYDVPIDDLHIMLKNTPSYNYSAPAPKTLCHRYLTEEVPTRHVPQLEMARILNVPQPLTREICDKACNLTGMNLFNKARTIKKMGLTEADIKNYKALGLRPYLERNKTV
ncbi:NAD/NADP octopine/nopaline dehydrogenase family protein [Enterovibrio nigricans]|uniref:NAD/NADP octopine/nopaline dehydrogenase, alpha-helical domain n=1 Tax=Enterovibrio nigricans DSM 22720 TaxID=1121868 RepID=A0A1T4VR92_9GAMM|nr:NAD/NADP octopine/nopaline dehydrogenase family protein [Enterovibrio nigricans]PKF49147.1 hypothetical protein AT251_21060 [Enterovibrio nigricans]SKA67467.1 NAD/NADP octopine/nopaline dehydrogenase, alpha-helical domain [Enterovibrio nigricans DSM 22720]